MSVLSYTVKTKQDNRDHSATPTRYINTVGLHLSELHPNTLNTQNPTVARAANMNNLLVMLTY